jgi:hypothetical protein
MPDTANAKSPVSARPLRTWDFMETALVCLIADGAFTLTAGLALVILVLGYDEASIWSSPAQLEMLAEQGRWQGAALILGSVPN